MSHRELDTVGEAPFPGLLSACGASQRFFVEVFVRPAGRTNTSTPGKEESQRDEQGFANGIF